MMVGQILSFQSGELTVGLPAHQVRLGAVLLDLEPKAFRVLVHLIENRQRTVTKEELFQAVWGETFVTDNALTRVIAQLRRELEDNARAPRFIETVPTLGYRFIAPVEECREGAPATPVATAPRRRRVWVPVVFAAAILIGVNAWFLLRPRPEPVAPVVKVLQITSANGLDVYPTLSPDGASMAYASDRKGSFEIYVRSLVPGGSETQLTNDGEENLQPQWSPDGRYLAFYSEKRNGIRVMPALGGGIQQITPFGSSPAWSPDGEQIVFRSEGVYSTSPMDAQPSGPATIWVVKRDGSGLRQLTRVGAPAGGHSDPFWAKDGRILFLSFTRLFRADLWAIQPDGSGLRQIQTESPVMGSPVLTADGRYLFYSAVQPPASMSLARSPMVDAWHAGRPEHLFTSPHSVPRTLAIAADGRRVLFSMNWITSELWSLPMDPVSMAPAGEAQAVVRNRTIRNSRALVSPDGAQILFFSRPAGDSGEAYVVPVAGGEMRRIPLRAKPEFSATWKPDSQGIVYVSSLDEKRVLCTSTLAGQETCVPVNIPLRTGTRVSPDASRVAYHSAAEAGVLASFVYDVSSGRTRRLSPPGTSVIFPCWSADGKWLAGEIYHDGGTDIVLLPAEGGPGRTLVSGFRHAWPHTWASDSDRIAFAGLRDGAWNLWWVSRSSGELRQLTRYRRFSDYVRYPAWSPKGDFLVYELARIAGNVYVMDLQ